MFLDPKMTLIHGECLEFLSNMPADAADVTVTSPPYNMNLRVRAGKHCSRQIVPELSTKYKNFSDNLSMQDYFEFNARVLRELIRVSPIVFYNVQFLTGNKSALYRLMGEMADYLKEIIIWDKGHAQPAIQERVLNSQFEVILVFDRVNAISRQFSSATFARGTLSNVWHIPRGKKVHKDHGAVFPEGLVERVLLNFTRRGDTVLDPFMGTGTTGVVCKAHGRNFMGVELDLDYFTFAQNRIGGWDAQS